MGGVSQGRPARRGTRSAQARFWERGRLGRRPQRSRGPILDGTGDSPPVFAREGERGPQSSARTGATRSPEALGRPDGGRAQDDVHEGLVLILDSLSKYRLAPIGSQSHSPRQVPFI